MFCAAMRQHSFNAGRRNRPRPLRSLRGFDPGAADHDPEPVDPLRIVALLEQAGGTATRLGLSATLHTSPAAVDVAVSKLESDGLVSAARSEQIDDIMIRLHSKPPRT